MKKIRILLISILVIIFSLAPVFSQDFSDDEKKALQFIKDVKEFGHKINLDTTENFLIFKDGDSTYNFLYYHKKTDMPFSYVDPTIKMLECEYPTLKENMPELEKLGINDKEYDMFFYPCPAVSNGTIITRRLLREGLAEIARVVTHEDFHNNVDLPVHVNEASALLVGEIGAVKFICERSGKSESHYKSLCRDRVRRLKVYAEETNDFYDKFSELTLRHKSGEISYEEYLVEKDKITLELKRSTFIHENVTDIVFQHTYTFYLPLMFELLESLDYDIGKFILIMKKVPFGEPAYRRPEIYFLEARLREKKIEDYLNKIIKNHKR